MESLTKQRIHHWLVVLLLAAELVGYWAIARSGPHCGDQLALSIPIGLLIAEAAVGLVASAELRVRVQIALPLLLLMAVFGVFGDGAIWVHFFGVGNCGE